MVGLGVGLGLANKINKSLSQIEQIIKNYNFIHAWTPEKIEINGTTTILKDLSFEAVSRLYDDFFSGIL